MVPVHSHQRYGVSYSSSPRYMKLINLTSWNSEDLSKLFRAGLRAKGVVHTDYVVAATYSRAKRDLESAKKRGAEMWVGTDGKALHGYAYLCSMWSVYVEGRKHLLKGKRFIRIFLPDGDFDLRKLAQIFEHEVDHTLGLQHKDMIDSNLLEPKWHDGLYPRHI